MRTSSEENVGGNLVRLPHHEATTSILARMFP
jgi:hypothetical protein